MVKVVPNIIETSLALHRGGINIFLSVIRVHDSNIFFLNAAFLTKAIKIFSINFIITFAFIVIVRIFLTKKTIF